MRTKKLLLFFSILLMNSSAIFGAMQNTRVVRNGVLEKPMVVIIPSYNNLNYYKQNIDSVMSQNYENYRVIYIDDCSNDGMSQAVPQYIKEFDKAHRWVYVRNSENRGAMFNLYNAIHSCPDDAIIISLDGDDWLKHENVLARVNREYADDSVWLTYGQFEWKSSNAIGYCRSLAPSIRDNVRKLRNNCGYATALRTFYAWLFKKVKKEDLMVEGRFFPAGWDRAMMAPMLEMASPNHFRCIDEILYVYNDNTQLNDHHVRRQLQWDLAAGVFKMPSYPPLDTRARDQEKRIVIVTASYKNAEWYKWNLDSVLNQNYTNWHMIYIDDCSPDGTGELVRQYVKDRGLEQDITVICNADRKKALANLYTAIHMCNPSDIVVILDGDDRFTHNNVLAEVNAMYKNNDVWLTYGQFIRFPGGEIGFCCPMPADVIENNAFRDFPIPPSHLRTFYAGLFHKIKLADLMYQGDFFPITYDLAIMYPMIEMARDHFMFCPNPLLEYNVANPINDHKVDFDLQVACDKEIRSRARYEKIEKPY